MSDPGTPRAEQQPLVSVVIPTYNGAPFIAETIQSVAAQTYPNWELIVVDDGSKDETAEVARASQIPAEKLRVLSVANAGAGAARQYALQLARGDLIAFLDHDDVWLPNKLADQVPVMLGGPIDVLVSDWYLLGFEGESRMRLDAGVYSGEEMFKLIWDYCRFPPSPVLVKKAALIKAGWFERGAVSFLVEDYALWLRLATAGATFAVVKEVCYAHRVHPGSLSAGKPLKMREADLALLLLFADDMRALDPERQRLRIAGLHDGIAVLRAEGGDIAGAHRALAQLRGLQGPWQVRAKMLALALLRRRYAALMRRVRRGDQQLVGAREMPPQPS